MFLGTTNNSSTHYPYPDTSELLVEWTTIYNMAEELKVVLRKSENFTYGFSLLGTAGLPHVIYDILENSPAAECGEVCFSI